MIVKGHQGASRIPWPYFQLILYGTHFAKRAIISTSLPKLRCIILLDTKLYKTLYELFDRHFIERDFSHVGLKVPSSSLIIVIPASIA